MNRNQVIITCIMVIIVALLAYGSLSTYPAGTSSPLSSSAIMQSLKNPIASGYYLPSTFTITTHGDFTSSGGTRVLDEKYTFRNDVLVSGTATYFDGAGGGCQKNCDNTEQCIVVDNQWLEVQRWQGCEMQFGSVPTKQSLVSKIRSGDLTPQDPTMSPHSRYTYAIAIP